MGYVNPFRPTTTKYPEFILGLRRDILHDMFREIGPEDAEGFIYIEFKKYAELVQRGIIIAQRNDLDESRHWGERHKGRRDTAQWLNYFVVEDQEGRINPYMRAREGNGESHLQGKGSVAPGGHGDLVDVRHENSVIDLRLTSLQNIMREAFEEMTFYVDDQKVEVFENEFQENEIFHGTIHDLARLVTLHFEGLIFDNSDDVGRLHLAVCWRMILKPGVTIGNREKGVDFIPPVLPENLEFAYPGVKFENWSQIFVQHLIGSRPSHSDALGGYDI